jgi:hypothetical protein
MNATSPPRAAGQGRSLWLSQLYLWHWISSALCLVAMMLFAATGLTLNHAGAIAATPKMTNRTLQAPPAVLGVLAKGPPDGDAPLPREVRDWLATSMTVEAGARPAEWSEDEVYLALPRPGGDAWVRFDRTSGEVEYEKTTRGAVALFNDLHKGRNTGPAWGWFIDVFAVACLVFCATGLLLLQMHARSRPITWPLVAAGLAAPLILILLFVHL